VASDPNKGTVRRQRLEGFVRYEEMERELLPVPLPPTPSLPPPFS
jgi:hypothetical protein